MIISNAIAGLIEPSFFINIINIKKLPFLPDIISSSSAAYNVYVEDFMNSDVRYIWYGMSYNQLKTILKKDKSLKVLPLVDSSEQMILLGSIQRRELVTAIESQVGMDRRMAVKSARRREADVERKRKMREVNLQKQEEKISLLQDQLAAARVDQSEERDSFSEETNSDLLTTGILELQILHII